MRVISGSARGVKLITPDGLDVRPTVDRVKEGIFSAIQFELAGARVLDLFAGSGQLGIEALSRGAKDAVFVDNSRVSLEAVRGNISAAGFDTSSTVVNTDSLQYLRECSEKFDFVFLDPPYHNGLIDSAMPLLSSCISDNAAVICERWCDESLADRYEELYLKKNYRYGKIAVSIYRKV